MNKRYYDRYQDFRFEQNVKTLPFIKINERATDVTVKINEQSRLDKISFDIYGTPHYGWLILQANPQFGGLEGNIPLGTPIRVPYPLIAVLQEIEGKYNDFDKIYGI